MSQAGIVNTVLFPPPTVVAQALHEWLISGELPSDLAPSLARVPVGFLLGSIRPHLSSTAR